MILVLEAINRLYEGAREGLTDTRAEFGTLLTVSPLKVKLDLDPTPLEQAEIEVLDQVILMDPDDLGRRVAMLLCADGQYLLLGKVK